MSHFGAISFYHTTKMEMQEIYNHMVWMDLSTVTLAMQYVEFMPRWSRYTVIGKFLHHERGAPHP